MSSTGASLTEAQKSRPEQVVAAKAKKAKNPKPQATSTKPTTTSLIKVLQINEELAVI